jgi:hypothetical protein
MTKGEEEKARGCLLRLSLFFYTEYDLVALMSTSDVELEKLRSDVESLTKQVEHLSVLMVLNSSIHAFHYIDYTVKNEEMADRKCSYCFKPIEKGSVIIRTLTKDHADNKPHLGRDYHKSCVDPFLNISDNMRAKLESDISQ